jgi:predicted phosphodiesterase
MRLALLSDIHGNAIALDAVLAELGANPPNQVVCLGDAIQGGAQPAMVVSRLRELGCPVVMGNADDFLLTAADSPNEDIDDHRRRVLSEVRAWSLSQLSPNDLEFIRGFQPTVEVDLGHGRSLLCFHGSPLSFNDVILPTTPDEDLLKFLAGYLPRFMCGGHTHVQHLRRMRDSFYFNPGAVGFAYNHDQPEDSFRANPWAEYALLTVDGDNLSLDFRRVPFDPAAVAAAYLASGRPFADEAAAQYRPRP